jgi:hypothetical protein
MSLRNLMNSLKMSLRMMNPKKMIRCSWKQNLNRC